MERNHGAGNLETRHLEHVVTRLWYSILQRAGSTASLQVLSLGACENRHVSLPVIGLRGYLVAMSGEKAEFLPFSLWERLVDFPHHNTYRDWWSLSQGFCVGFLLFILNFFKVQ